jgi:hypothetical protein
LGGVGYGFGYSFLQYAHPEIAAEVSAYAVGQPNAPNGRQFQHLQAENANGFGVDVGCNAK